MADRRIVASSLLYLLLLLAVAVATSELASEAPAGVKMFVVKAAAGVGAYIGTIAGSGGSGDNDNESIKPPFYVVPIVPDDLAAFSADIAIDLETGDMRVNSPLLRHALYKCSVLSINEGSAITLIIHVVTTTTTTTTTATATTTTTTTTTSNDCLQMQLFEKQKQKQKKPTAATSSYTCFNVNTRPSRIQNTDTDDVACSMSTDNDRQLTDVKAHWTGMLTPKCSNSLKGKPMRFGYVDRRTVEMRQQQHRAIASFDAELEFVHLATTDDGRRDTEAPSWNHGVRTLRVSFKCKSSTDTHSLRLNVDDDGDDNQPAFVLIRARDFYSQVLDTQQFTNAAAADNTDNFMLLTTWRPSDNLGEASNRCVTISSSPTTHATTTTTTTTTATATATTKENRAITQVGRFFLQTNVVVYMASSIVASLLVSLAIFTIIKQQQARKNKNLREASRASKPPLPTTSLDTYNNNNNNNFSDTIGAISSSSLFHRIASSAAGGQGTNTIDTRVSSTANNNNNNTNTNTLRTTTSATDMSSTTLASRVSFRGGGGGGGSSGCNALANTLLSTASTDACAVTARRPSEERQNNNTNEFDVARWRSLLAWNVEYYSLADVLLDLAQLKR